MTVKNLIKQLLEYPMDYKVVDTADSPIMYMVDIHDRNAVRLEPKNQMDVANELEARIRYYELNGYDEVYALDDILKDDYTLDDFEYDKVRYEWAKRIAEEHGLV